MVKNEHDVNAIAVKDGAIVGHLPRAISCVLWLILKRGDHIVCKVMGKRRHNDGVHFLFVAIPDHDLPSGYSAMPLAFNRDPAFNA